MYSLEKPAARPFTHSTTSQPRSSDHLSFWGCSWFSPVRAPLSSFHAGCGEQRLLLNVALRPGDDSRDDVLRLPLVTRIRQNPKLVLYRISAVIIILLGMRTLLRGMVFNGWISPGISWQDPDVATHGIRRQHAVRWEDAFFRRIRGAPVPAAQMMRNFNILSKALRDVADPIESMKTLDKKP